MTKLKGNCATILVKVHESFEGDDDNLRVVDNED